MKYFRYSILQWNKKQIHNSVESETKVSTRTLQRINEKAVMNRKKNSTSLKIKKCKLKYCSNDIQFPIYQFDTILIKQTDLLMVGL